MSWTKPDVVFAVDCEMVTTLVDGKRKQSAGHVVLVKSDAKRGVVKVLDTYVHYDPSKVQSYNTRYSHIEPWMVEEGVPLQTVAYMLLRLVRGHTLVTFGGRGDLASLGLNEAYVRKFVKKYVDLQTYFQRTDGSPYGLGPLVDYFGYTRGPRAQKRVVINHDVEDDAKYTLFLYLDDMWVNFVPSNEILTTKSYRLKYRLY